LLHAEVVSDKPTDVVTSASFDGSPVCIIESVLILRRLAHQDVVSDLVTFGQGKAGGVEALKNELGIIMPIKGDADDLQLADSGIKIVDRYFIFQNLFIEEAIVQCQVGCRIIFFFIAIQLS